MTLFNRAVTAIVFSATLFASTAVLAAPHAGTPFDLAPRAYRGQIEGIPGYQSLQSGLRNGNITGEDILKAAGVTGDRHDARLIEGFLRDSDNSTGK